jgi:adenine deaminase
MNPNIKVSGQIFDIVNRNIFSGTLIIEDGIIADIKKSRNRFCKFILPGFIDSHIHIESSLLVPSIFGKCALKHGVIAAICDPHEIANMLGVEGIRYMISSANQGLFKFYFGAPSCVPSTDFETSGAKIGPVEIERIFEKKEAYFLAEMMNVSGVVNDSPDEMNKIRIAMKYQKKIDGHAPGLTGNDLNKYVGYGISTDHECTCYEEAVEKIQTGMKILIRNGSAAKNLYSLAPLFDEYSDKIMICSDDLHAEDLINGYLLNSIQYLIEKGYDIFNIISASTINVIKHYNLDVGLLQIGDPADFIISNDLKKLSINETFIGGINSKSWTYKNDIKAINNFKAKRINIEDLRIKKKSNAINLIRVINN